MSESELAKLQERLAALEQQLAEEREEFEWDLKAARESAAAASRKLEDEIATLKASGPVGGDEALTQRALMAERKVAELQQEIKRTREAPQRLSSSTDDSLMRQRAEAAEQERDKLLRDKRSLERQLEEKERALKRAEDKAGNTAELRRELEETRRDKLDKERLLASAKRDLDDKDLGEAELTRLGRELAEVREALAEKDEFLVASQTRVRELAEQLAELEAVRDELDEIRHKFVGESEEALKREERVAALKAAIQASDQAGEQAKANEQDLKGQLDDAQAELARTKMASSQMLEQRERELARLRADLEQAQESARKAEGVSEKSVREVQRVERELQLAKSERDEAVQGLRQLREAETTQVGRPPEARDPFDEKTQRVPMEQVSGRDPFVEQTLREQAPRGAAAEGAEPPECISPELASGTAKIDGVAFPAAGGIATGPGGEQTADVSFGKGETMMGEPPMPAVEDLEPVDLESVDEADLDAAEQAALAGGAPGVAAIDAMAGVGAGDDLEPAEDEAGGETDDLGVEWVDEGAAGSGDAAPEDGRPESGGDLGEAPPAEPSAGEGPQAPLASDGLAEQVTDPVGAMRAVVVSAAGGSDDPDGPVVVGERTAEVRTRSLVPEVAGSGAPKKSKGLWIGLAAVGAAGLLIVGAWFLFPLWFGLETDRSGPDPAALEPLIAPADAGSAASADGGTDAAEEDGGQPAPADPELDGVAEEEPGPDGGADEAPDPGAPKERSPKDQLALEKAQAAALKLILGSKHKKAQKFLVGWVKREPEDARLRYLYGRALVGRKKIKAAAKQMQKAIALDPDMAEAYYEMGGIHLRLKDKPQAKEALAKFLELAPQDPRAAAVRRNLKKM